MLLCVRAVALLGFLHALVHARPNFVFINTDDQDVLLDGLIDMPATKAALIDGGRTFRNGYTVDPICCPSRTALLSGRMPHNLDEEIPAVGWCGNFVGFPAENNTWVRQLHDAGGFTTALYGKYTNNEPVKTVPAGYDHFFGLINECQYYNNSFAVGSGVVEHFGDAPEDYMTSLIGNRSIAFARAAVANASNAPFFLYIAPHAPHMPTTPAPWYMDTPLPSQRAPRTPAYNASGADKQWVTASLAPLDAAMEAGIDHIYTLRHRALLSVDDIVRELMEVLAPVLNNTYIFYSSDHGYNLGTFRLAVEKFHFMENDINVPFLVRGPGITPGSVSGALVSQVDIGATILELAGVPPIPTDGRSFASQLVANPAPWARDRLVVEYFGGGYVVRGPCNVSCGICDASMSQLVDAPSNTWSSLRIHNATTNVMYAEFRPSGTPAVHASTNVTEFYDLNADPFQLVNLAAHGRTPATTLTQYSAELFAVARCVGAACP